MRLMKKTAAWLTVGGTLMAGNGCLPDNFWADYFGGAVASLIDGVVLARILNIVGAA